MKFISEIEQQTHWLRTYHCYCINSIPILKTRNQTFDLFTWCRFFGVQYIYIHFLYLKCVVVLFRMYKDRR